MEQFEVGDLVVLTAGSMRMAVEAVEGGRVHVVWCHEGAIGRDAFAPQLLKRWEVREHEPKGGREEGGFRRPRDEEAPRRGGGKPYGKPFAGPASPGAPKPRPKTGWDGKPREKKFFRKD
jgi:uncharacterized protein YodC (DUF2158 family)